jgi:hypothetical protein
MGKRTWTPEMLERLKEYATCPDVKALATELGVTYKAIKSKAKVSRIIRRPGWTDEQVDTLKRMYSTHPAADVARAVEKPLGATCKMASNLGLAKQKRLTVTPQVIEQIRRMNQQQVSDTDIAASLDCDRHTVSKLRKRMGLPSWDKGPQWLEKVKQKQKQQLLEAGVDSLGQIRSLAYQKFAVDNGWPADTKPRAVQVLNLLASHGVPMNRRQIAEGIGMPRLQQNKLLLANGKGGTHLAQLVRAGLVIRLKRSCRIIGQGSGRTCDYYILGPVALKILKERADAASCHEIG